MLKKLQIGKKKVGDGQPVFIIAEVGVNHNGSLTLARKLIDVAKNAGADAVKFQTFIAEELVTKNGAMAAYQKRNTGKRESQLEMLKRLELSAKDFTELASYAKKRGIIFISTPHSGFGSVDMLQKIGVPAFKFGSADINNFPTLAYAAKFKKPMIISSGIASMKDLEEAVGCIRKAGNNKIILFQCTTDYPSTLDDAHLRAMVPMRQQFKVWVGYSDHTVGSVASVAAVALGACMLEKHITLDNTLPGPDHKASANPEDFKRYVQDIRDAERTLGSSKKVLAKSAQQYIPLVTKSVVARGSIAKGETFTKDNLAIKRPGKGLSPKYYSEILGKKATRNIQDEAYITKKDYTQK